MTGRVAGPSSSLAPPAVLGRLTQIERVARENLLEARALVEGRGPGALRERGLEGALHRLVDSLSHEGIEASLVLALPEALPPALQVVVLRLVQESLSNVVRHARAERVEVVIEPADGVLVVSVADDGVGIGRPVPGLGLTGMRTRVELLEGELTVGSDGLVGADGRAGTLIKATMPL